MTFRYIQHIGWSAALCIYFNVAISPEKRPLIFRVNHIYLSSLSGSSWLKIRPNECRLVLHRFSSYIFCRIYLANLLKEFMRERKKVARRAKFSKRRTTTFVNDDDSKRLKELQEKYEDNQGRGGLSSLIFIRPQNKRYPGWAKKLRKQNSAADLIREREDKLIKGMVPVSWPLGVKLSEITKQYIQSKIYEGKTVSLDHIRRLSICATKKYYDALEEILRLGKVLNTVYPRLAW